MEDEKDPDVIPQGKKTEKPLNSTSMFPVSSNYGEQSCFVWFVKIDHQQILKKEKLFD